MWSARVRLLFVGVAGLAIGACANAGPPNGLGDGHPDAHITTQHDANNTTPQDGNTPTQHDAKVFLDAAANGDQTLSETTTPDDDMVTASACAAQDGNGDVEYTGQNSYYRVFKLSDFNITGSFAVDNVHIVVDGAASDAGQQNITVKLGTYTGTFADTATTLTKSDISIPSGNSKTVQVTDGDTSEDVAYSSTLSGNIVVEIDSASGSNNGDTFFLGANADGETPAGFYSSTDCSVTTIETMKKFAGTETDLLFTISGIAQ
jgi:hypothetical protein